MSVVPFRPRPHGRRVPGERIVAVLAGIIDAAALHPDRNDVERRMPMDAARFAIEIDTADFGSDVVFGHLHLPFARVTLPP